jgi:alginate O-acetyltransferase complex protein AlgJ
LGNRVIDAVCNISIVFIFIIVVCSLPIVTILMPKSSVSHSENRQLASMPEFVLDINTLKDYPQLFETYFNDNFGLRKILLGSLSDIKVNILHKSPVETVLLGKEGWLYYNRNKLIDDYRGLKPYTAQQLALWKNTIENRQKWLADQGIKYLFVVAPEKHSIYPEFIPDNLHKIKEKTRLDQLLVYFQDHSRIRLMDLREPLQQAKSHDLIYYKTGTHWTDKGAYIAYTRIMDQLIPWFPELSTIDQTSCVFKQADTEQDLSNMLGLSKKMTERNYFMGLKTPCARGLPQNIFPDAPKDFDGSIIVKGCSKGRLRAVVFRDSFFSMIEPFLSEHFECIYYVWDRYSYSVLKALIAKIHPDIVIEERVERYLSIVPSPADSYKSADEYSTMGRPDLAIELFLEALRIDPSFTPAMNRLARVYLQLGDYQNAFFWFNKMLSINPNDPTVYYNIACIYAKGHDTKNSMMWLKKAVEKNFKDWKLLQTDEDLKDIRLSEEYKQLIRGRFN